MLDRHIHVIVVPPEIMLDGLQLGAPRHHVVVELAPPPVAPWIDKHHVVPTVVVARMHQDGVQRVVGGIGLVRVLQVGVEGDFLIELEPVVELHRTVGDGVALEPHQV